MGVYNALKNIVNYLLSERSILNKVERNLGEEDYKEPLSILLDSLNNEANLSLIGKIALRYQISSHLKIRSKIFEFIRDKDLRSPSKPIFVIGLPRSGTTFLFNLLSLDSNHRSPLVWEMFFPFPLINKENKGGYKSRIKKANLMMGFQRKLIPEMDFIHPIKPTNPEECLLITPYSLKSLLYSYMARIPTYEDYLKHTDQKSVFLWHYRFLQTLESSGKPKRWLLKDPAHIGKLSEIISTYPDASFIQIHRDPAETIPSICSLTEKTRSAFSNNISKREIGSRTLAYWENALSKGEKEKDLIDRNKFIDIKFDDFVKDPLRQIELIYSQLGLILDRETKQKMNSFSKNQETEDQIKHRYDLNEFGLSTESVQNTLSKYLNY